MTFVHLHNHSQFSVLDGHGLIENYIKAASADGQSALALTDHGSMAGAIEFYSACKAAGIKPIVGAELYVDQLPREKQIPFHLTVLAADERGYRDLIRVNTETHRQFYYRPRITLQELIDADAMRHWFVLTGCMSSAASDLLIRGEEQQFLLLYGALARASLGCFVEVMYHATVDREFEQRQNTLLSAQLDVAYRHGLPLVLTNDCHYVTQTDEEVHQRFVAQVKDRLRGIEFDGKGFYLKTSVEMRDVAMFLGQPSAYDNTSAIADRCELRIPEVDTPSWYVPALKQDSEAEIRRRCSVPEGYEAQFEYEIGVLRTSPPIMNSYLVAADLIDWCRAQGIPAAGRGSMAGSLVSWLLGITTEDPVLHRLKFERAVNPARLSIPDFDIDVSSRRRKEVLAYLAQRYSQSAAIASYSEHGPKGATRMIMRALNHTMAEIGEVTRQLGDQHATVSGIHEDDLDGRLSDAAPWETELAPVPEALRDIVRGYLGLYGNMTVHPAGVLIAGEDRPLDGMVPMAWVASSKQAVTQYDMHTLKKLGMFKLDVLGLSTLDALAYLREATGVEAPTTYDDADVFKAFSAGFTSQIFQMDGFAARATIKRLGIRSFEDLVAVNALVRPGAAQFIDAYKSGESRLITQYPTLAKVLGVSRGLILYDEQVMEACAVLAGFDDLQQDDIRQAVKHFQPEVFAALEPQFLAGCTERGHDGANAWQALKAFAGYAFPRAHAVTYAALAYKMQWYKVRYPEQFYAATFDDCADRSRLMLESQVFEVRWCLPDVNRSEHATRWNAEDGVVLGLGTIKGIGEKVAEAVSAEKPYTDTEDLKGRVARKQCNVRHIALLSAVGAIGDAACPAQLPELLGFNPAILSKDVLAAINIVERTRLGGFIIERKERTTKKGDLMGFLTLVNGYGEHKAIIFPKLWSRFRKAAEMMPVLINGEWIKGGEFAGETMTVVHA